MTDEEIARGARIFHFKVADGKVEMIEVARFDFMPLEFVTSNKRLYGDPECV